MVDYFPVHQMNLQPYMDQTPIVYVLRGWGAPHLHKIGCTGNLRKRYQAKRTRACIVAVIQIPEPVNMYLAEEAVHNLFAHRRVGGEVFDLLPGDLELMSRLYFCEGVLCVAGSDGD